MFFNHNLLVYGSYVLVAFLWYFVYKTRPGLHMRSVGESPRTADSLSLIHIFLGIAGVAGNGQRELTEVITGLRKTTSGTISLLGQDITNRTPLEVINSGVSFVPEDRYGTGMAPNLSLVDNVILKSYRTRIMCKGPFINYDAARRQTQGLVEQFQVKCAGIYSRARLLSGGNAQKLLLGREISSDPKLLIAAYPTRGLDIGAAEAIRSILINQRNQGIAILLISEDLEELMRCLLYTSRCV